LSSRSERAAEPGRIGAAIGRYRVAILALIVPAMVPAAVALWLWLRTSVH